MVFCFTITSFSFFLAALSSSPGYVVLCFNFIVVLDFSLLLFLSSTLISALIFDFTDLVRYCFTDDSLDRSIEDCSSSSDILDLFIVTLFYSVLFLENCDDSRFVFFFLLLSNTSLLLDDFVFID